MRKTVFIVLALLACAFASAKSPVKVRLMPQWTQQAQFAGYYAALENGYYKEEGLDVEICHISVNSTEHVIDYLASHKVEIITQSLLPAILARADGLKLVNVLQLMQRSPFCCVSSTPISSLSDLEGKKVGKWSGHVSSAEVIFPCEKINVDWVPFIQGVNLFVFGAVDAILCNTYNEYIALLMSVGKIDPACVYRASSGPYAFPEDGVYVTEDFLRSNPEAVEAFRRATVRGWEWVADHREEALEQVMRIVNEEKISTNLVVQRMMLDEVLSLMVNPVTGRMDFAPVSREVYDNMSAKIMESGMVKNNVEYSAMFR